MKIDVIDPAAMPELKALNLDRATPLWYYILKESELQASGEHLGPVGGRIVAEVLIGLLQGDKQSFLSQEPDWLPTLPTRDPSHQGLRFSMVDLLTVADPNAGVATLN